MTEQMAIKELEDNIDLPFGVSISDETCKMAIQSLEEREQYRAIGTVEELQALKEKSVAKKPNKDEFDRFTCPDCGWIVSTEEYGGRFLPHCENCGQAIDYSE